MFTEKQLVLYEEMGETLVLDAGGDPGGNGELIVKIVDRMRMRKRCQKHDIR